MWNYSYIAFLDLIVSLHFALLDLIASLHSWSIKHPLEYREVG